MRTCEAWEEKVGEVTARGAGAGETEPLPECRGCPGPDAILSSGDVEVGGGCFQGPGKCAS